MRPFLIPGSVPAGPEEHRRAAAKRGLSWALVGVLHLGLFFSFVIAFRLPEDRDRNIVETILMLAPTGQSSRPTEVINPDVDKDAARRMYSAPLTIPPPIVPPIVASEGRGPGGVDVLGAVGRILSCGAGSWEHLTQVERAQCYNIHPWVAGRLPNGNLVMVPAGQLPRLREPPPDSVAVEISAPARRIASAWRPARSAGGTAPGIQTMARLPTQCPPDNSGTASAP